MSDYMQAIAEMRKAIRAEKARWRSYEKVLAYEGKLRVDGRMYELEWMQTRLTEMVRRHKNKGAK